MSWFTALMRRPPIGWWDLADILVVSILIYEVLKLIRGTRAVQMALGGAHIVRVHAVADMVQVVRVAEEIRRQQP